jgi:hypothetical protein
LLRLKNSAVGWQDTAPKAKDGESPGRLRESLSFEKSN